MRAIVQFFGFCAGQHRPILYLTTSASKEKEKELSILAQQYCVSCHGPPQRALGSSCFS